MVKWLSEEESEQPDEPEEGEPVPAADPDGPLVGSWNGLPNYKCPHCPGAYLSRATLRLHVSERHGLKAASALEVDG